MIASVHARFYAPALPAGAGAGLDVELPDDEAAHLVRVLRLGPGADVRVFDGAGREFLAVVGEAGRRRVAVRLLRPVTPRAELGVAVTLVQAVLKGDKVDGVVRDAVMMGVRRIQPVITERTEVRRSTIDRGDRVARWRRIAVASAKQCGRAVVPEVLPVAELQPALRGIDAARRVMLTEPDVTGASPAGSTWPDRTWSVAVLVGPEGGWTPDELELATGLGWQRLTMGGLVLRADAAALVAISVLLGHWGEL